MTRDGLTATLSTLDAEWESLSRRSVPIAWLREAPELGSAPEVGGVRAAVRQHPDAVLLALLRLHRAGDPWAGRVVVQLMLPKLVLMAVRNPGATLDDHLTALWECLCTYPIGRRPTKVAANLALDTLKSVSTLSSIGTRAGRPHLALVPCPDDLPDPAPRLGPDPDGPAVLAAASRLGLIDPLTQRTLECVYVEGRSSREAAAELGMTADVVRWRCSRAVRTLRARVALLTEELAG